MLPCCPTPGYGAPGISPVLVTVGGPSNAETRRIQSCWSGLFATSVPWWPMSRPHDAHPTVARLTKCVLKCGEMIVRAAQPIDASRICEIIEPVNCAGETYALPRNMSQEQTLAYWMGTDCERMSPRMRAGCWVRTIFGRISLEVATM